jgi:polyferredoxin
MNKKSEAKAKVVIQFIFLIGLVILFSMISTNLWAGTTPEESAPESQSFVVEDSMSLADLAEQNNLSEYTIEEAFGTTDMQIPLSNLNLTNEEVTTRLEQAVVLGAEHESKDWVKIAIKFSLWFAFLIMAFVLMRKSLITVTIRKWLYLTAIVLFGVILGSDPSPMGTVKDAVALFGATGVIFPPRLIAFTIFMATVVIVNKFICSWGCQFGVLQDFIFRINRNKRDIKGIFKQYKLPFVITNSVRVAFFTIFTAIAFLWATDMIESIDPFKIYKPTVLTTTGIIFVGSLLITSLFIYRPWCTMFCPFGLTGWLGEKFSLFKINVDYDACIDCDACVKACPSTAMNGILKQKQMIPDCFACSSCIDICPTNAIKFQAGKRNSPPPGMFKT